MGCELGQLCVGHRSVPRGRERRHGLRAPCRDFAHTQDDVGQQFRSGFRVEFGEERRLQKRQLLEPDGILDEQIEFVEADLDGPGVRADRLSDENRPLLLDPHLDEPGLQTELFGHAGENRTE